MSYSLATYRRIPHAVLAVQNAFGSTEPVTDSDGIAHQVPAGWWLVDEGAGRVSVMSDEAFRPHFEEYRAPCPLDSFIDTVGNLNANDMQQMGRTQALESGLAAAQIAAGNSANQIAALEARCTALEAAVHT